MHTICQMFLECLEFEKKLKWQLLWTRRLQTCLPPGRFPMTSSSWRFFLFGRSPVSWHLDVTKCYFLNWHLRFNLPRIWGGAFACWSISPSCNSTKNSQQQENHRKVSTKKPHWQIVERVVAEDASGSPQGCYAHCYSRRWRSTWCHHCHLPATFGSLKFGWWFWCLFPGWYDVVFLRWEFHWEWGLSWQLWSSCLVPWWNSPFFLFDHCSHKVMKRT